MAGMCSYADRYVLELYDFLIMNEILYIKNINEDLAYKSINNKGK